MRTNALLEIDGKAFMRRACFVVELVLSVEMRHGSRKYKIK